MIYDKIMNFKFYEPLHKFFAIVLQILEKNDLKNLGPGKYNLTNGIFYMVNEYTTKHVSECFIECHRKYIDIQIMINGNENIGICNKTDCLESLYDEDKDFQKLEGDVNFISLKPDYFVVFFPQDGHMPQVNFSEIPQQVKKIVFKIPV